MTWTAVWQCDFCLSFQCFILGWFFFFMLLSASPILRWLSLGRLCGCGTHTIIFQGTVTSQLSNTQHILRLHYENVLIVLVINP